MTNKNNARIVDTQLIRQAGMIPSKYNLRHSLTEQVGNEARKGIEGKLFESARTLVRTIDEQNAISRFKWYNLPCNLSGEELERLLYYKGQLAFFYMPETDEYYFMPYTLSGTIDFYGRFNSVRPVPMTNGTDKNGKKEATSALSLLLSRKILKTMYGINTKEDVKPEEYCVLLHDHCKQLNETITPRQYMNDDLCGLEAELLCYMRTNAIAGSGVRGMRVSSGDESANVAIGNKSLKSSAIKGDVFTAMVGNVEWQELLEKGGAKMEEYFQALQAVDNFRLSTYGLGEGQLFEKKAHMLQSEADKNQSNVGVVLSNDLAIRQNFCIIANALFGTGIWCEPNEAYAGQDIDGDGKEYSDDPQGSGSGIQGGDNQDETKI